ncbi:hypothetical protein EXT46_13450 [Pseudoalteromonas sp. CO325X]|nr:hypothetical protein EXT46_13450 [Pseudoalteromonas sp. CO325X]
MSMFRVLFFNLIFISVATMANDKPANSTDEQWNKYLEYKTAWEKMLKERYENELKSNPPEPPWVKFPDFHPTDMFWRMGKGENYLVDYFGLYFKYAPKADLKAYKQKYPEHKDWLGTYENFEN